MINIDGKPDLLLETSWEVCNKVGGIYTVLSTKAKTLQNSYKDRIIFIGPDLWTDDNPSPYFTESKTLLKDWKKKAALPDGVRVRVGRWNVPGKPIVILVKYDSLYSQRDRYYTEMWNLFRVDSLHSYGDYDESCMFALAAALVIESLYISTEYKNKNVIAHFDEWTTGMGLLYIKAHQPKIATVFTTHATSIGRSICGNGKPLYDYMRGYNGDQMAAELNMQSKHSLEKAAAWNADCFTTVSDVTAVECEQLLERRPIVTPNGFEENFVPTKNKYNQQREKARCCLLSVAKALTGHDFSDDTVFLATSGRNEFRNKGLDAFLDSMNVLRTKWQNESRDVVCFIFVPAWVDQPRHDLQEKLVSGSAGLLERPFITHTLHNYYQDCICNKINSLGFNNNPDSNFFVIYVPSYLNGDDGILNISYYDVIPGLDCSIFASYYEPWGYTPLESMAFGVPTITTNLAGYGQWLLENGANSFDNIGAKVITRNDSNYSEAVDKIAEAVYGLIADGLDSVQYRRARTNAQNTSKKALWEKFISQYDKAYSEALKETNKRI